MNYKFYRALLVIYAFLILMLSSTPSNELPKTWLLQYDKVIHFFEYFIFGILSIKSIQTLSQKTVLVLIPAGLLFGLMDEYLQSFISGRFSSGFDVLSDTLGFTVGLILVYSFNNDR